MDAEKNLRFYKKYKEDKRHKVQVYPGNNLNENEFIPAEDILIDGMSISLHFIEINKQIKGLLKINEDLVNKNKELTETINNLLKLRS